MSETVPEPVVPAGKLREILLFPDPRLTEVSVSAPVCEVTFALARDLIATAKAAKAAGLSAPQVGVPVRVVVIEVGGIGKGDYRAFINPRLVDATGEAPFREGCLSFPGIFETVKRPDEVTVEATGLDGKLFTTVLLFTEAEAIQHEIEHLDGVLLIDKVFEFRRHHIRTAMKQVGRRLKRIQTAQGKKAPSRTKLLFGFQPEV